MGAAAVIVDTLGKDFLPGTGGASEKDGGIGLGSNFALTHTFQCRYTGADHVLKGKLRTIVLKLLVFQVVLQLVNGFCHVHIV